MVTKVSGTEGVDQVKADTLTVDDAKAGQAVGFNRMQLFAAKATTSGTSVDFSPADGTGIPSWAKRITVMFDQVSTSGTSVVLLRMGTSSGIEVSGYSTNTGYIVGTNTCAMGPVDGTGVYAVFGMANAQRNGCITLHNISGNAWTIAGNMCDSINDDIAQIAGRKALAGLLDRIRLTTVNGTDTFDGGSVSILVEGYE